ncbi:esterase-like activity of phytase family protein [soil metagenome]
MSDDPKAGSAPPRAARSVLRLACALRLGARVLLVAGAAACGNGGVAAASAEAPRLEEDAIIVWRASHADFGGFSAVEVLDGGARFVAVTDQGHWASGTMEREAGRLVAVSLDAIDPLRSIAGRPLTGDDADAEGIALDSDGRFFVSFEGFHRIRRYDRIDGPAAHVDGHREFRSLQRNSGLEALAIDAQGALYAIPERSGALDRPFPVYRKRAGAWDRRLSIPRSGSFLVTGADFGPDGALYVLERDFTWLGGFRTRIRRFVLGAGGLDAGTTLLETARGALDNMEGISVWQDASGAVRITLLSDDNFFPLQRTLFAEYLLTR